MFKKGIVLFFAAIFVLGHVAAQAPADHKPNFYYSEMLSLQDAIKNNFFDASNNFYKESVHVEPNKNAYSYLWPLCGLIQANNEIEKVTNEQGLLKNICPNTDTTEMG